MSKVICIDAGHGGKDSGAVGNGVIEKDVALKTALIIGEMLKEQGFDVVFTRTSDVYVQLNERCKIANSKNADLFISVHINSAANENAKGTETLCYSKNKFAELVQKNLVSTLNTNDRGVKERKDLAVLNGTKMTAVLLELGFLSNREEAKMLQNESFIHNVAKSVVVSVCNYFGVCFKNYRGNDEMVEKITVKVNGKDYKADRILKEDKNFICIKDLEQAGFEIGYDKGSKVPSISNGCKELKLNVDGKETSVEAVNINGSNFVPIRSLASATGKFDVDFENGEVVVRTK